jgi:hypothetical protein
VRISVAALVAVGALLAGSSAQAIRLPKPNLPPGWSHAEVNVVIRHVPHTLTYDRGRVTAVSTSSLTVRERDGSLVTVPVSAATIVKISGRRSSISQVGKLETATTVRVDGGPAALVTVQVPPRVAARLARLARRGSTG